MKYTNMTEDQVKRLLEADAIMTKLFEELKDDRENAREFWKVNKACEALFDLKNIIGEV